jgi:ribosomal protein S27E
MATPPPVASESRIPEAEVISYGSCVSCPTCQNRIINDGSRAGQTVKCPHCGDVVQMPGGETQVIPPPAVADSFPVIPNISYERRTLAYRKSNPFIAMIVPASMVAATIGVLGFWYFGEGTLDKSVSSNPASSAATSVAANPAPASPRAIKTKREFKKTFYSTIRNALPGVVSEKAVTDAFGEPFRTQTVHDNGYWYWRCKDGQIQMVIQGGNPEAITGVIGEGNILVKALNDY